MAMTVQQYVQDLLDKHGTTGKFVAEKAGMSASYFYRVLGGENISPKFLRKIAPHVRGASVHRMMVLADYLPDDEGGEHESLDDLKVRVNDLRDKLGTALEKYIGSTTDEILDVVYAKKLLQVLVDKVETGKVYEQFGWLDNASCMEMVSKLWRLEEAQGKLFTPLVEELGQKNIEAQEDKGNVEYDFDD
ncbi:hypothetical protein JZ785_18335 [Alicyclobacillus curvatus]|nr:hypothetical protein JZ785_18335 [Alicyclobacillus curvatus]